MEHKIGSHISIRGGYTKALERAHEMGENTMQIFSTSPMQWKSPDISDTEIEVFQEKSSEFGIDPVYFHGSYLLNFAGSDETVEKAKQSVISELTLASKLGVVGSVIHVGSYKNGDITDTSIRKQDGYEAMIKSIQEVLEETPDDSYFLVENSGTRKIGQKIEQLAKIIEDVGNERVRVCLDTCHLHVAGYDLSTKEKLNDFLNDFDDLIGLERLELFHVNDSKDERGSLRDRHENIGQGKVGIDVFKNLLNHEKLKNLPFILETPGFGGAQKDAKNIAALRELIE